MFVLSFSVFTCGVCFPMVSKLGCGAISNPISCFRLAVIGRSGFGGGGFVSVGGVGVVKCQRLHFNGLYDAVLKGAFLIAMFPGGIWLGVSCSVVFIG